MHTKNIRQFATRSEADTFVARTRASVIPQYEEVYIRGPFAKEVDGYEIFEVEVERYRG